MQILFVLSFYSSLRDSILNKKWEPTGMPAIAKLFEQLEKRQHYFDCIFVGQYNTKNLSEKIRFENFSGDFYLINPLINSSTKVKSQAYKRILKLVHYIKTVINVSKLGKQYDVYYVDRANVIIGAILSYFYKKKVFLRLHGVTDMYVNFRSIKFKLLNPLEYWSYKAPFSYVLCSEDGTQGREFLDRYTKSCQRNKILLNGVDIDNEYEEDLRKIYTIPDEHTILLFVSRLEKDKGIDHFINALLELNKINTNFYAFVVGEGGLLEYYRSKCIHNHNINFVGPVPHNQISRFYRSADIFVSLNELGNLCNTMLEALRLGNCIVTFTKDEITGKDITTEKYLKDIALFIERKNCVKQLVQQIIDLMNDQKRLYAIKEKTKIFSETFLSDWETRIHEEIDIIQNL